MAIFYDHEHVAAEKEKFISSNYCTNIRPEISNSWLRSQENDINPNAPKLPPLPPLEQTLRLVTEYSRYIKKAFIDFYEKKHIMLDTVGAVIFYLDKDLNIYIREGNRELYKKLKEINLAFGANLGENLIGTNAAALAAKTKQESWVFGNEHYINALHNYFCAAVPASSQYKREVYIMLVAPMDKLNPQMLDLFKFILATENTFAEAVHNLDLSIKDEIVKMNMEENDSMLIITDSSGIIIGANHCFFNTFGTNLSDTVGKHINKVLPELEKSLELLNRGVKISTQEVHFPQLHIPEKVFYIDAKIMRKNDKELGTVITLSSKKNIQNIVNKVVDFSARFTFADLLGNDPHFINSKKLAIKAAKSSSNVLIVGESGTGKELFAHAIHNGGERKKGPFITINCAAIPKELIGSELFGYVDGAFTGARKGGAAGKFELANGGTLFLDEIGEMPLDMQAVLLRVLEDKMVTRIGGSNANFIDVRLIAATNQNLRQLVDEKKFRLDLYYRLNVLKIEMVPLRKRPQDIPFLVEFFLKQFALVLDRDIMELTPEAMKAFKSYPWRGNIRELRNMVERIVNNATSNQIGLNDLPADILSNNADAPIIINQKIAYGEMIIPKIREEFDELEENMIRDLLEKHKGNKSQVAAELGIARTTLYRKLKKMS